MKTSIFVIALFYLLMFVGCKSKTALNENGVPDKLILGVFGGENPGATQNIMEPIRKSMEQELGLPVELLITNDYTAVIEALHAKKIHVAYLGPFSYIIASQKKDIEPIAVLGVNGKPYMYHSTIFVKSNSGINNLKDVKSNSKNLTFCFTDPASTSGHLVPRYFLNSIGIDPSNAFKETIFAGSHVASVLTVASGKIDIGCATDEYGVDLLIKKGMIKKDQLKIIWTSDPIVGSPLVILKDINKAFATKVQSYFINMGKNYPIALKTYIKTYYAQPPAGLTYVAIDDSLFNGIRRMAGSVKELKLVN